MAAEAAKKPKVPVMWVMEPNPEAQPIFPWEFRVARAGGFSVAGGVDGSFLGEDAGDFQFPGFFPSGRP